MQQTMKNIFFLLCVMLSSWSYAQKDSDVLFTVGNNSVTVLEFKQVYEKNRSLLKDDEQKDVKNYLDLYVKFKLKLAAARALKLDTASVYKKEVASYKKNLITPYLRDSAFIEKLVKEAYYRTKYEVNASHILVKIPKNILPKDTLPLYTKIMQAREAVLSGQKFSEVALQYSEDPSVKTNFGDLGYFTAFRMVREFEDAAYETKVNEVSKPFRTRYGYHFLKVNDLQLSEGEVEVAHIFINEGSKNAKEQIDSVYTRLIDGEDFDALVLKYSTDRRTRSKSGKLPKFGKGRMPKPFEDQSFQLVNANDFTQPFRTRFGWHIVKLVQRHPVTSFKEMRAELEKKVNAAGGARLSDEMMLAKLKAKYKIAIDAAAKKVFDDPQIRTKSRDALNETLLSIETKQIAQYHFYDYIINRKGTSISVLFENFLNQEVLNYFKENLRHTSPRFGSLMQEYEEGVLVFDFMQKKVWDIASNDAAGLQQYFESNSKNYKFKDLTKNKGKVMSDYQAYLEVDLDNTLKKKYPVEVQQKVLKKIIRSYKKDE